MNEHQLYLLLNLGTISIPLMLSFYTKAGFYKTWNAFFPAMVITAAFFVAWDVLFTNMGVWGFNPRYLTGVSLLGLPIEEWMFFVTIPYACTFTYFVFNYLVKKDLLKKGYAIFAKGLAVIFMIVGILNFDKYYTVTTFILAAIFIFIVLYSRYSFVLSRFFVVYLVILLPFFLVNGLLTGSWIEDEVVWYNNTENLGIRLGTIPLEDTVYGLLLLLMNIFFYERFLCKSCRHC